MNFRVILAMALLVTGCSTTMTEPPPSELWEFRSDDADCTDSTLAPGLDLVASLAAAATIPETLYGGYAFAGVFLAAAAHGFEVADKCETFKEYLRLKEQRT